MALPIGMTAKQWVVNVGLDPRHFESGRAVWQKKPRISKAGNKYIRQALYMSVLVATCHESNIKGYWHLTENNGLKKIQAISAVMRNLLHTIHDMLKTNKEFDGSHFYTLPVQALSKLIFRVYAK